MYGDRRLYGNFYMMMIGRGSVSSLGEKVKEKGCTKVIVVHDKPLKDAGVVDKVTSSLQKSGIEYVCWDGVLPDPTTASIDEAAELARREKVDGIVALGGGSGLDAGKALDVLMTNPGSIVQYLDKRDVKPGVPTFLIGTTSGSGAEVTMYAIISDETGKKRCIYPNYTAHASRLAIIDAEMAASMPPSLTAYTGVDAFCHAVEAFTCNLSNALTDRFAMDAMRMVVEWLPRAVADGSNMDAREGMHVAQLMAGLAFNNAATHAGHAIGHVLGKLYHIPHGIGCAFAVGEILEFFAPDLPEKIRQVGLILGADIPETDSVEEIGRKTRIAYNNFKKQTNCPRVLDRGVTEDKLAQMKEHVMMEGARNFTVRPLTVEDFMNICVAALRNEQAS